MVNKVKKRILFSINRTHNFMQKMLILYLLALCFSYTYGINLNSISIRISDIILFAFIFIGVCLIILRKEIRIHPKIFLPIIPFILLETILPIIGAFSADLTDIASGFRILILYLPIIVYFLLYGLKGIEILDNRISNSLKIVIVANFIYSMVQLLVVFNYFPENMLVTKYFEQWTVDEHFQIIDGIRASGFFVNTTSLSVFGLISMSYFLAKYRKFHYNKDLLYAAAALTLIIVSTSRMAYISATVILVVALLINIRKSWKFFIIISSISTAVLFFINKSVGFDMFFSRFIRLQDGLENDYSMKARLVNWDNILEILDTTFPIGTLISPIRIFGSIDSGYLTYYAQGKWLFILALVFLFLSIMVILCKYLFNPNNYWSVIFLLFVSIYVFTALIISNPLRSPTIIFFLTYSIVYIKYESRI
ncbi:O-antigen ligase family protein [Virgibacillus sp. Bac330]|uniref:O-antigen ligase family protein n=1 Tax=Virgibacillus sp. Bac330 TaxID=2419841 RepID=UPI000EF4AEC1|nr:O-antigen ligase family protein [Virgibacillus sp. Bac330]